MIPLLLLGALAYGAKKYGDFKSASEIQPLEAKTPAVVSTSAPQQADTNGNVSIGGLTFPTPTPKSETVALPNYYDVPQTEKPPIPVSGDSAKNSVNNEVLAATKQLVTTAAQPVNAEKAAASKASKIALKGG